MREPAGWSIAYTNERRNNVEGHAQTYMYNTQEERQSGWFVYLSKECSYRRLVKLFVRLVNDLIQ